MPVFTDAEGTPFVVGVDIATGSERWRLDPGSSVVAATPSLVVLGAAMTDPRSSATPGRLHAVDRATGAPVWTSDVRYAFSGGSIGARLSGTVSGELLVVPTGETMTGIDLTTGAVLWTSDGVGDMGAADGVVVGTATDGSRGLVAVDASTGAPLWEAEAGASYGGWLAIGDGVVVALSSETSEPVAFDLRTGEPRWSVRGVRAEPQMIVGTTALLLWEGTLAAVSTTDGSITWKLTEPFNSPFMNAVATNGAAAFVAINSLPWRD